MLIALNMEGDFPGEEAFLKGVLGDSGLWESLGPGFVPETGGGEAASAKAAIILDFF
ncbi:MAG: hypothetical protein LBQ35_02875 [Spirochaetaceae bacterium]|nr:hypothetical protein [Spirochaetaceae bacterium]